MMVSEQGICYTSSIEFFCESEEKEKASEVLSKLWQFVKTDIEERRRLRMDKAEANINRFQYHRGEDSDIDLEWKEAPFYGKVKLGQQHIFWKKGFHWFVAELAAVQRAYRRVEEVNSKMCCGNVNFDIQKLVLLLREDVCLEILIGDGIPKEAEALYKKLKDENPQIQYGKM